MKILLYSTPDGSEEYLVPVDEDLTQVVISENARPGFTLDGAFELVPVNPFRGACNTEPRLGAEYTRGR